MLQAYFLNQNFQNTRQPELPVTIEHLKWAAVGGPESARLRVDGLEAALWDLAGLLRNPVEIRNGQNLAVWWGYVAGVRIASGSWEVDISLDDMANRIAVAYAQLTPGARFAGLRKTTPWANDSASQASFGIKEAILSLDHASDEQAIHRRDAELAARSRPSRRFTRLDRPVHQAYATLVCRGWWQIYAWQRYIQPAGWVGNEPPAGGTQPVGSAVESAAQPFTLAGTGWWIEQAWTRARKIGAPGDYLRLSICANQAGSPGSELAALDVPAAAISGEDYAWAGGRLANRVYLQAGQIYWLRVQRTGGIDPDHSFSLEVGDQASHAGLMLYADAAWNPRQPQAGLIFKALGAQETTQQIALAALGATPQDFVSTVRCETGSGVFTCPFRDGDSSRLAVIQSLLESGTADGQRLLATVHYDRALQVASAPQPGQRDWFIACDGQIVDERLCLLPEALSPAGHWLRYLPAARLDPPWADPANPLRAFVETAEYDPTSGKMSLGYSP